MAKTAKTNAMRILDKEGLAYTSYTYGGEYSGWHNSSRDDW